MDVLFQLLTQANITLAIALIALLLCIINAVNIFSKNSFELKLDFNRCSYRTNENKLICTFNMNLINNSQLPLGISKIYLYIGKYEYEFNWMPSRIGKVDYPNANGTTESKTFYSVKLPNYIDGYGVLGNAFCLVFDDVNPQEMLDELAESKTKIAVETSRGTKTFKIKFDEDNLISGAF